MSKNSKADATVVMQGVRNLRGAVRNLQCVAEQHVKDPELHKRLGKLESDITETAKYLDEKLNAG